MAIPTKTVIPVTEDSPRVVTSENPLIIKGTQVTFENIVIEGGEIVSGGIAAMP